MLEATAATAQAQYDLQTVVGAEEIAHGDLATALGLPPQTTYHVQDVNELKMPGDLAESVDTAIDRAFEQRPDLKAQLAQLRAANATIKQAKSRYYPSLSFNGNGGLIRDYGQQGQLPPGYVGSEVWDAELALQWTLFDGGRREHAIAQAKAEKAAAIAEINSLRDQISDEVWTAYSNVKTAQRQQQAAAALLISADQSYTAARESYGYGVRNLLDVVSAQKTLAQARTEDVTARTQLLLQVANLAFRTGDSAGSTAKGRSVMKSNGEKGSRLVALSEKNGHSLFGSRFAGAAIWLPAGADLQHSWFVFPGMALLHYRGHFAGLGCALALRAT